jgi:hypothetical protein
VRRLCALDMSKSSLLTTTAGQKFTDTPRQVHTPWQVQRLVGLGVMTLIYAFLTIVTNSNYFGDTELYASSIIQFDNGGFSNSQNTLWESGHLYWRPAGLVLYRAFGGLTSYSKTGEYELAATAMLVAITTACGLACALLLFKTVLRFLKRSWAAILVATGFLSFYGFLNYVHTGSAYVPGLAGILAGIWTALIAVERCKSIYGLLSGFFVGLAVLLWLPYALALPGVVAFALLWNCEGEASPVGDRIRAAVFIAGSAFTVIAIGYLLAIIQLRIFTISDVTQWVLAAGHGASQNKRLIRLATGMPRSFIYLGNGGVLLKRYFLGDPYAHSSLMYLAQHFLSKLMVFYVFLLSLCIALLRSAGDRRIFWIFVAGTVPTLMFAVLIFEPGSAERYLPLYPFLCIAAAYVLSQPSRKLWASIVIVAFLAITMAANISALWKSKVQAANAPAISRVEVLQGRVTPEGLVALVTFNDGVYQFTTSYPFHPANRRVQLPIYDVIQVANLRVLRWKQEFAQRALTSLDRSAAVWISKRVLAAQPDPAWDWVEGDDAHITWRDIPGFFRQFSYSDSVGGPDGFVRLEPSRENMARLEALRD